MKNLNANGAAIPSPACGRGWRGAAEPGEGFASSHPERPLNQRKQMIPAQSGWRINAEETPSKRFQFLFTQYVTRGDCGNAVDAAVGLNDKFRFDDREVDNESIDRMLTPYSDADFPKRAQRFPCGRFRRVRHATKASSGLDVLVVAHSRIVARRSLERNDGAPHPLPLSRKRERGEKLQ